MDVITVCLQRDYSVLLAVPKMSREYHGRAIHDEQSLFREVIVGIRSVAPGSVLSHRVSSGIGVSYRGIVSVHGTIDIIVVILIHSRSRC